MRVVWVFLSVVFRVFESWSCHMLPPTCSHANSRCANSSCANNSPASSSCVVGTDLFIQDPTWPSAHFHVDVMVADVALPSWPHLPLA